MLFFILSLIKKQVHLFFLEVPYFSSKLAIYYERDNKTISFLPCDTQIYIYIAVCLKSFSENKNAIKNGWLHFSESLKQSYHYKKILIFNTIQHLYCSFV